MIFPAANACASCSMPGNSLRGDQARPTRWSRARGSSLIFNHPPAVAPLCTGLGRAQPALMFWFAESRQWFGDYYGVRTLARQIEVRGKVAM